jgi:RNA polymerase sigma factor (sigma-70 family)
LAIKRGGAVDVSDLTHTRESVIERARRGDTDELARLYSPLAYRMACKQGLGPHDAEDIQQQTMMELLAMLPRFEYDRARGSFKGLLKMIVSRRILDLRRRGAPVADAAALEQATEPSDALDELFEREWRDTHWTAALERVRHEVKPSTYQSFHLTAIEGRSAEDAAAALGLSKNQISQNRHRVTERIRTYVAELVRDAE